MPGGHCFDDAHSAQGHGRISFLCFRLALSCWIVKGNGIINRICMDGAAEPYIEQEQNRLVFLKQSD